MRRGLILSMGAAVLAAISAGTVEAQAPGTQIQNGTVEVRHGTSIDREISGVPAAPDTPAWIAWRVPMIAGDRDVCSTWTTDRAYIRGTFLDDNFNFDTQKPQIAPPKMVALEGGTNLVVLARLIGGKVERLRSIGDDCPVDAGGRNVYWLDAVTPAESLRYLSALAQSGPTDRTLYESDRNLVSSAVSAIAYHRDAGADPILDRIAADHRDSDIRHQAASRLARYRGAHGVAAIAQLISTAREVNERRSLTSYLGSSQDPSVVAALRRLTTDGDKDVRSEAIYYYILRAGAQAVPDALKTFASDKDENVRKRAVSAIGRLPADVAIPNLLQLARTSTDPVVRKQAVSALSQSKDPRAVAYLEELIKR